MNKLFVLLAALMALSLPNAGQAIDVEAAYVGGLAGVNFAQYHKNDVKVTFEPGLVAGGLIGYRWCGGFRAEAEVDYRWNRIKSVKLKHVETEKKKAKGNLTTWSFMANGLYEIPVGCFCITPIIGAGIGYDATKLKACRGKKLGDKNGFAWQLIAGGLYPIDECIELGLEYRYHRGPAKKLNYNAVDFRINWFW